MNRGKAILIALGQLLNTLTGGWPDETMSSRAYRLAVEGTTWPMRCIDAVAGIFGDKNHCEASCDSERVGRQLPPELRKAGMSKIGECESGRTWNGFRVEGGKAGEGVKFERIRRITGYLVGTVDRFNDAKRAEVRDRVKHARVA